MQQLGLNFEIYSPDIDESVHEGELVHQYVERLAREKAQAVLNIFPDSVIIAADTSLGLMVRLLVNLTQSSMPLTSGNNYLVVGMMYFPEFVLQHSNKS